MPETQELVSTELLPSIRNGANELAESGEMDCYALTLDRIAVIETERDKATVNEIMTRTNTVAAKREEFCKAYSDAYYRTYKAISQIAKDVIQQPLIIRYRCQKMLSDYLDSLEEKRQRDQAHLDEITETMRAQELERAQQAALAGDMAAARQHQADSEQIMRAVLQESDPGLKGASIAETNQVTVDDLPAFLRGILDGDIPLAITTISEGKKANRDAPVGISISQKALNELYQEGWPGCSMKKKRGFRVTRKET